MLEKVFHTGVLVGDQDTVWVNDAMASIFVLTLLTVAVATAVGSITIVHNRRARGARGSRARERCSRWLLVCDEQQPGSRPAWSCEQDTTNG